MRRTPFVAFIAYATLTLIASQLSAEVDYSRDVVPILAEHCYQCHGPDMAARKADLRLDRPDPFIQSKPDKTTLIHPGHPELSELAKRIKSQDPEHRMPPAGSPQLSKRQVSTLNAWILEGAQTTKHWAFVPPRRPKIPPVRNTTWPISPIDYFVLSKLESKRLQPAPRANSYTLLRRATLDSIGLIPTPNEIRSFQNDASANRWLNTTERLLASPSFGEHVAQDWLDAARYADTTGHAADRPRTMWLFRDWVIQAINSNMPFDQFSIEQLSGDMLQNPSESQLIATGFHRNSIQALGNNPRKEEYRVKGIVDRLETTGRVWLGLSLGCAECHDHKYDPLSQREYYQLYAIFNNIPHLGERFDVHGPRIDVLPRIVKEDLKHCQSALEDRKLLLASHDKAQPRQARIREWAKSPFAVERLGPVLFIGIHKNLVAKTPGATIQPIDHQFSVRRAAGPANDRTALRFDGKQAISYPADQVPTISKDLSIGMWIKSSKPVADLVSRYDWKSGKRSFVFGIGGQADAKSRPGRLSFWASTNAKSFDGVVVYGSQRVDDGRWHHVAVSSKAGESVQLFVDGIPDTKMHVEGKAPRSIAKSQLPLAIGGGFDSSSTPNRFFFEGELSDIRIFDRPLTGRQMGGITLNELNEIRSFAGRSLKAVPARVARLYDELATAHQPHDAEVTRLESRIVKLKSMAVTAQVMQELPKPRQTHIHVRGNFEQPGEQVEPALPTLLAASRRGNERVDRLAFAQSLFSKSNPLTARVTVNRIWYHYFGVGLVRTLDDFGRRGELPSHPKLLDWLALELIESEWDVKHIHRLIMNSATYQQDSTISKRLKALDPNNRLLARGPRFRMSAEQIRDVVLQASGHLVDQLGGPSVYPKQDPSIGQFRDKSAGQWKNSQGAGQFRRAVYTFWQRMSPYPSAVLFDAPSRERCTVGRQRTNTPLQALTLLNDPYFVRLAENLGARIENLNLTEVGKIKQLFLLVLSRPPRPEETRAFEQFLQNHKTGKQQWFLLAQVILNLDEAITRE